MVKEMSHDNIELTRQYFELWNAQGIEGTKHLRHPEIEIHDPPTLPDAAAYVGEEATRERIESYLAFGWDGQFRVEEYIDAGDEVVVMWRGLGRGASGGVPLDFAMGHVCLFESGKLRRVRQYLSKAEALDAVGLAE
jgi:ketosteroid isomerase-like protein